MKTTALKKINEWLNFYFKILKRGKFYEFKRHSRNDEQ